MEETLYMLDKIQRETVFFDLLHEIPASVCWQATEKSHQDGCNRVLANHLLDSSAARVAMLGGGNSFSLAFHVVLAGAMLTVVDHLVARGELINNGQWHLLEDIACSAALTGSAYATMRAAQTHPDKYTLIRATTREASAIKYSDVVLLETPFPFDNLFFAQLEQIRHSGHPGQLVLLDCDARHRVGLHNVLKHAYEMLPHHAFVSATACPILGDLECRFRSHISSCREGVSTEQIGAFAQEFMACSNSYRLDQLAVGDRNPEQTLQISKQLLMSAV